LDIQKDILYTFSKNSPERISCQSTLLILFRELTLMLAPVLSFTAEEAWKSSKISGETIFKENLSSESYVDELVESKWDKIFSYREMVLKKIESLRSDKVIGSSLEAEVVLACSTEDYNFIFDNTNDFKKSLMVAKIDIVKSENVETTVEVLKTSFKKCIRCWNFSDIRSAKDDNICMKCETQLNK
jgi:isoleucyl-tRNA synthetase